MSIVNPILFPASASPLSSRLSYPTAFLSHKHFLFMCLKCNFNPLYCLCFLPFICTWHHHPLSYSEVPESSLPFLLTLRFSSFPVAKPMDSVSKMYLNPLSSLHFHWQTAFTGVQTTITSYLYYSSSFLTILPTSVLTSSSPIHSAHCCKNNHQATYS